MIFNLFQILLDFHDILKLTFTFLGCSVDELEKRELVVYECDGIHGFCCAQLCCGWRRIRSSEV